MSDDFFMPVLRQRIAMMPEKTASNAPEKYMEVTVPAAMATP
jgi:hypothetical protein